MPLADLRGDYLVRQGNLISVRAVWRGRPQSELGGHFGVMLAGAQRFAEDGAFARTPRLRTVETTPEPHMNGDFGQQLEAGDVIGVATFAASDSFWVRDLRAHLNSLVISGIAVSAYQLGVVDTTDPQDHPNIVQMTAGIIAEDPVGFLGDVASGVVETARDGIGALASAAVPVVIPIAIVALVGLIVFSEVKEAI